jgi:hypothetical protein
MVGTNHTSIAQTDARKARAPRVVIVEEKIKTEIKI